MAQLSDSQLATISDHPIGDALNSFRTTFNDLALLYAGLSSNETNFTYTAQLLRDVVAEKDDPTIWATVYDLIRQTQPAPASTTLPTVPSRPGPETPPKSTTSTPIAPPSQQTPTVFHSGSGVYTSETRDNIDPMLKAEVERNLIIDHPEVFDAFWGRVAQLPDIATAVLDMCKGADEPMYSEDTGWVDWPPSCKENEVLRFLRRHVDQFLAFADERGFRPSERRRCVAKPNQPLAGSVAIRKLDIGIARRTPDEPYDDSAPCNWSQILIPGELKSNPVKDNHNDTWLDIARYAREVFAAQDTRRFVLGFTLCGSNMRLWEFDRLGCVGSTSFNIHTDGHKFVSVILGCLWMNDEELGFDPTIVEDDGRWLEIQRGDKLERIFLEEVIKPQRSIAGRGTTCRKGRVDNDESNEQLVIKDSWEYEERPEEGLLLQEATAARVTNVAQYYHHETVRVGDAVDDVVGNIRKTLSGTGGRNPFERRRIKLYDALTSAAASGDSSQGSGRGGSRGRARSRGQSASRKRSSSHVDGSMPPPKRPCSDSAGNEESSRRRNRVHRRVIIKGVGKSLYEASSLKAMLTGLLGGLKGHESLLEKAKILHRDISIGNVLLNDAEDDGFLIDVDLAIKTDREEASGAPSKTGTKVFMAIGALYGEDHSFMHDLESFFWLLFWICTHWNGAGPDLSISETSA
ncbi:hypothetical protein DBV05_g12152 [Lasiodiplodia theobromae]|uniref:EKC/KEOPS complex subunit BUD32 n=1 Tax=Lasiodiplodia theobromae TaxID=45133 RepID=A0A5N5CV32_9PEZI|nr:hypothetical protein DBV05_g12152 [Lasiodiplodia theobromae]